MVDIAGDAYYIRSILVDDTAPTTGDMLYYDGTEWHLRPGEEIVTYVAGEALNGHRMVRLANDGKIYFASNTDSTHKYRVVGMTTGAIESGASGEVRTFGRQTEPTWSWTMGSAVYLSTNGLLTQTPPATGFQLVIGYPVSATGMYVRIGEPIVLA